MTTKPRKLFNKQAWAAGLFWSWNLIFLAFMFLGFAPTVLPEVVTAVQTNDIPAPFLVYAAVLTLIPAVAVMVGFIWLRRQPEKLFALGYGVEGPLMLVLAIRFFVVRQAMPPIVLILAAAGLGILAYLWHLLDGKIDERGSAAVHFRFIGLTLLLIVGLYASVWILFYVVPFIGQLGNILRDIGRSIWYGLTHWDWQNVDWRMVPFFILYFPLMAYTATLFVLMPVAVSILYTRAWLESVRALAGRYQRTRVFAVGTAVSPPQLVTHRVDFPNGQTLIAQPITAVNHPTANSNLHLAVILDRSRSMESMAKNVGNALLNLSAWGTADIYLTASELRGEEPSRTTLAEFDPADVLYFGGQNAAELLTQFDALYQDEAYDAILVLTDGTGYELDDGDLDVPMSDSPVWMVHLDGRFPIGYDDATLEAIQASGGGAVGSVDEALTRLRAENGAIIDGYLWTIRPTESRTAPEDGFAAIAARQFILAQTAQERASIGELITLDTLHTIAVEQGIVTPYSSMIVLVTERQQQLLDEMEAQDDRFEREYEEIGETGQLTVTGVPEPEEWLLIGLATAMLGWRVYTSRKNPRFSRSRFSTK